MLVLSRQRDESLIIGEEIVITVVDIRGDKVRLGIDAPKEIPVHREEVYEAIQRENVKYSKVAFGDYLNDGDWDSAYSMLHDGYQASNEEFSELSKVMDVSSESIRGSLDYVVSPTP
tara:strand:- start:370 stop:720 length:351 start_codon:yes stop_codon:yes gene_type:complete